MIIENFSGTVHSKVRERILLHYKPYIISKNVSYPSFFDNSRNFLYTVSYIKVPQISERHTIFLNAQEKKFVRYGKRVINWINYKNVLEKVKEGENVKTEEKHIFDFLPNITDLKTGQPKRVQKKYRSNVYDATEDSRNKLSCTTSHVSVTTEIPNVVLGRSKKKKVVPSSKEDVSADTSIQKCVKSCNDIDRAIASEGKTYQKKNKALHTNAKICFDKTEKLVEKEKEEEEDQREEMLNGSRKNITRSYIPNEFSASELESIELLESEIKKHGKKEKEMDKDKGNISKSKSATIIGMEKEEDIKELQKDTFDFVNKNTVIKKIYKASVNHVRDENLWKKYVQNVFVISAYLDSSDIVILFWCFSKIGYRDNRLINLMCSIILKKINELNTCALALLLNSLKKLEVRKYDTIELLTNQFCFQFSKSTFQDLALVANTLSYFYIYHKTFWKKCVNKLVYNYYFTHPLHLCLTIAALARLDIREGNVLLGLSKSAKKLGKDFSPNNLALVIHSFAKLKFRHPHFYNFLYKYVYMHLDQQYRDMFKKSGEAPLSSSFFSSPDSPIPLHSKHTESTSESSDVGTGKGHDGVIMEKMDEVEETNQYNAKCHFKGKEKNKYFDLQSLVLLLFSCVCLIDCTEQMILKLTYLIIPHKTYLGNHKIDKLKYVSDVLQHLYPSVYQKFPKEIKTFFSYIDRYELHCKKHIPSARWINELSRHLGTMHVSHVKNVYINNICANITLTDSDVIIKCLGPYSYYVNSIETTAITDLQIQILKKKNNNKVIALSYHDWNRLNDYEEKINFLYSFGRNAANYFFENARRQLGVSDYDDNITEKQQLQKMEMGSTVQNNYREYSATETRDKILENDVEDKVEEETEEDGGDDDDDNDDDDDECIYSSDEETEILEYLKKTESYEQSNTESDDEESDYEIQSIKHMLRSSKK